MPVNPPTQRRADAVMRGAEALEIAIHRAYGPLNCPQEDELFDQAAQAVLDAAYSSWEPTDHEVRQAAKALADAMDSRDWHYWITAAEAMLEAAHEAGLIPSYGGSQ